MTLMTDDQKIRSITRRVLGTREVRVKIIHDEDAANPLTEFEPLGTYAGFSKKYTLGTEQPSGTIDEYLAALAVDAYPHLEHILDTWENESWTWLYEKYEGDYQTTCKVVGEHCRNLIVAVLEKHYLISAWFVYDRGAMLGCEFRNPYDGANLICALPKAKAIEECGDLEKAKRYLDSEFSTYEQYLRGQCYGFKIEERGRCECEALDDDDCECWDELDSCWGFYGEDPIENGMLDYAGDDKQIQSAFHAARPIPF